MNTNTYIHGKFLIFKDLTKHLTTNLNLDVKEWIQNGTRCLACSLRATTQVHAALRAHYHNDKHHIKAPINYLHLVHRNQEIVINLLVHRGVEFVARMRAYEITDPSRRCL
jgi:hypothetical protein